MKKNVSKKRVASMALALTMCASLMVGSMAYFTDRASTNASATAGTVTVMIDAFSKAYHKPMADIGLDADGKAILNPGDARYFDYTVNNLGNKSIDVKETIIIYSSIPMTDTLNSIGQQQAEYAIYESNEINYNGVYTHYDGNTKSYVSEVVDANGANTGYSLHNDAELEGVTRTLSDDGLTLTYEFEPYVLNGNYFTNSDGNYIQGEAEPEANGDAHERFLAFLMKDIASNDFQGAEVSIELMVEAKQHRNTENVEWTTIKTEKWPVADGRPMKVVPNANGTGM